MLVTKANRTLFKCKLQLNLARVFYAKLFQLCSSFQRLNMSYQGFQVLLVEQQDKILLVKFNNPAMKNSLGTIAYGELNRILIEVNDDDGVTIIVITGEGDIFTAGNELKPPKGTENFEEYLTVLTDGFKVMIQSFIKCKKPIITLINGPAIGIGTTIAGISDITWCVEEAYFSCPFTKLGLVPEACSTYMLPHIMGRSKAAEVLMFNERMTLQEAYDFNLVSRIYKSSELDTVIWPQIREYSERPPNSMKACKRLMTLALHDNLMRASEEECAAMHKSFTGEDFFRAIINFSNRKAKL